jgi:hypothetical protein
LIRAASFASSRGHAAGVVGQDGIDCAGLAGVGAFRQPAHTVRDHLGVLKLDLTGGQRLRGDGQISGQRLTVRAGRLLHIPGHPDPGLGLPGVDVEQPLQPDRHRPRTLRGEEAAVLGFRDQLQLPHPRHPHHPLDLSDLRDKFGIRARHHRLRTHRGLRSHGHGRTWGPVRSAHQRCHASNYSKTRTQIRANNRHMIG